MIQTKFVSSMEKCFSDSAIGAYPTLKSLTALRNERVSWQLLYTDDASTPVQMRRTVNMPIKIEGVPEELISMRHVDEVPVTIPSFYTETDGNYLRNTPGLYPDVLTPLQYKGSVSVITHLTQSVWFELDLRDRLPAGKYSIKVSLLDPEGNVRTEDILQLEILDALLPPQEMLLTQWFHCDCLANYYHVDAWSEEHWRIVENFAATAVRNGINMLLTPIHTPPLDTQVGGERTTVQLVDVTVENGKYSFGFEMLDRWIDMCDRVGIKYFEIAHLFTQWGAEHAPKIMATVDGEYKRIFGWETEAAGEEYTAYLRAFLPAFLSHMQARGDDKRCYFHISDEPNKLQLESYRAAKNVVADILKDYPIMDALSNYEFYQQGLVKIPIPSSDHIDPFIERGVSGLWTYYCCSQGVKVSNRFIAMPLWRTRSIGLQLYKFNIVGFLQWGYNFYNNLHSTDFINPYLDTSSGYTFPAGDAFSVYPAYDGSAQESIRILSFYEALQDVRAMKLAEQYYGKEKVVAELEQLFGEEIRFDRCAHEAATLIRIRERINEMIKEAIAK